MRRRIIDLLTCVCLIIAGSTAPAISSSLEIVVTARPPYYVVDKNNGVISGLVAGPAVRAVAMAGLQTRWQVVSFNRQLQMIRDNRSPICGVGWFMNPERQGFAKFTVHLYQDQPLVALITSDRTAEITHRNLRDLMGDTTLRMGRKLGFSYGDEIDAIANRLKPPVVVTDQSVAGMVRMLVGRRFDYMIAAPEEARHLIDSFGAKGQEVAVIKLLDMHPRNKRYFLCSQSVGDDVIQNLNAAILELRGQ